MALSRLKLFKPDLFSTMLGTQHHSVYVIVQKRLDYKTIVIWLELRAKLRCWAFFLAFLALSRIKWFKLGFFGTKLGTEHYLVYVIVVKWLESKTIVICLKLSAKLRFWVFFLTFLVLSRIKGFKLGLFGTTWHTILFRICYFAEMVWI